MTHSHSKSRSHLRPNSVVVSLACFCFWFAAKFLPNWKSASFEMGQNASSFFVTFFVMSFFFWVWGGVENRWKFAELGLQCTRSNSGVNLYARCPSIMGGSTYLWALAAKLWRSCPWKKTAAMNQSIWEREKNNCLQICMCKTIWALKFLIIIANMATSSYSISLKYL